jgi:hypothetical protein
MADQPTYTEVAAQRDLLRATLKAAIDAFGWWRDVSPGLGTVREQVARWRTVLEETSPSPSVEGKPDILDTVTGLVPPDGDAASMWAREPAVVAGFIASVVTASEQAQRMTAEEADTLPAPVVKALGTLHGAVRTLTAAFELAAYPMRLTFGMVGDNPQSAEDVDPSATEDQFPPAGGSGPSNVWVSASAASGQAHVCVTLPTERAQRLGVLTGTRAELGQTIATAERIADDVAFMRRRRLCLACGYPLDNTSPHPLARPSGAPSSSKETE